MLTLLMTAVLLHPVHETQSEVEWNPETARLEIAVRLDILDEQWLAKRLAGTEKVGVADRDPATKDRVLPAWSHDYLRRRCRLTPASKKGQPDSATYHWIGRKPDGSHVWWFFEIEPRDGRQPEWIEITLLREHPESYTHRVLVLGLDPKPSLTLTDRQRRKPLPGRRDRANIEPPRDAVEVSDGS